MRVKPYDISFKVIAISFHLAHGVELVLLQSSHNLKIRSPGQHTITMRAWPIVFLLLALAWTALAARPHPFERKSRPARRAPSTGTLDPSHSRPHLTPSLRPSPRFTGCGVDNFGLQEITNNPDPVRVGQHVKVTAKGRALSTFESGTLEVDVSVAGIKVRSLTIDPCANGLKCPVEKGKLWRMAVSQDVPKEVPKLTADLEMRVKNAAQELQSCIRTEVQFE